MSLPPREERMQSQRRSMLATDTVEASVEQDSARATDIKASCERKLSAWHSDLGLKLDSTNNGDDDNDDYKAEKKTQLGNGHQSPTNCSSSLQSQQEAGVRRSSQDATASQKAMMRPSIIEATPSPKEKRRSLQQPPLVVRSEGDHAEEECRRQSHVTFEVDGFGIVEPPLQKLLTAEELTPPSTADVDTPSKLEPSSADDDYNDDNGNDCSHEETGMKETEGFVEQKGVVAEHDILPPKETDDDYNDDYNSDAEVNEVPAIAAVKETEEGEQAALDAYLDECF